MPNSSGEDKMQQNLNEDKFMRLQVSPAFTSVYYHRKKLNRFSTSSDLNLTDKYELSNLNNVVIEFKQKTFMQQSWQIEIQGLQRTHRKENRLTDRCLARLT